MLNIKFIVSKFSIRSLLITVSSIDKYLKPMFRGNKFIINCAVCKL